MSTQLKPGMLTPEQLVGYEPKVAAYRNLHFRNSVVYSVRDRKRDRLISYVPTLTLRDVVFRIKESERRRAVLRHERNVHAFADGFIVDEPADLTGWREARYHPFKWETFVDTETEAPLLSCSRAHLGPEGLLYLP